jgi:hypothetical protein
LPSGAISTKEYIPNSSGVKDFTAADLSSPPVPQDTNAVEAIPKGSPAPKSAEFVKKFRLFIFLSNLND